MSKKIDGTTIFIRYIFLSFIFFPIVGGIEMQYDHNGDVTAGAWVIITALVAFACTFED